jgi:hypothetical protein
MYMQLVNMDQRMGVVGCAAIKVATLALASMWPSR